jgi:hypothetical protein
MLECSGVDSDVEARSYGLGICRGSVVGHVTPKPILPLKQRTLEPAQYKKNSSIYNFEASLKTRKTPKNLIEDKKAAQGKRVQRIISMRPK